MASSNAYEPTRREATPFIVDEAVGVPETNFERFCRQVLTIEPYPAQITFYQLDSVNDPDPPNSPPDRVEGGHDPEDIVDEE